MNKKGHLASAVAVGSGVLLFSPSLIASTSLLPALSLIIGAGIGGLSPDFDHKTGTASNWIQFSAKKRSQFRFLALCLFVVGICIWGWNKYVDPGANSTLMESGPLWIGAAVVCSLAARLRTIVLCGLGILLLYGFFLTNWHWAAAVAGLALLIMPFVKHRGIIHSPEFAVLLGYSFWLLGSTLSGSVQATIYGFIIGWWVHLIGDCFGKDGISSILFPKFKVALKMFQNGGSIENWIARFCWTISFVMLLMLFSRYSIDLTL
ncbi:metal-dependent hydrolase [Mycobacterium tuberculosis]|uniref:metal-dependent hydrolase n=1 Tax=Mycobacterium tuberculosis TaxID=1773 RepID=UPI0009229E41|nr:metal-dependent hydrolase [Mycobacterium tuberculosis]SGI69776.1 Predicted membrane-bound metal-dependent hydrolase (DUF457) [Mycobacterium tuberculosis]